MPRVAVPAPADRVTIAVTMDNYYNLLLLPEKNIMRHGFSQSKGKDVLEIPTPVSADHGFSCYIEATVAGQTNALLFDFGWSLEGTARNMAAMDIDLSPVKVAILSHGHFDHYGGLEKTLRMIPAREGGIPLFVGKEAFCRRYTCPLGLKVDMGRLDPDQARATGCEIKEINHPEEIIPGVLVIGPVPRLMEFEQGSPAMMLEKDGSLIQDHFDGELSLAFNIPGKGLVILSACAHAGIVNTIKQAIAITGVEQIHAVLGGFHLSGAPLPVIEKTVACLKELAPKQIVPMHCTGFQAQKIISDAMPEAFSINSVGSRYLF